MACGERCECGACEAAAGDCVVGYCAHCGEAFASTTYVGAFDVLDVTARPAKADAAARELFLTACCGERLCGGCFHGAGLAAACAAAGAAACGRDEAACPRCFEPRLTAAAAAAGYRKLAMRGSPDAALALGLMVERGAGGLQRSRKRALALFETAALAGSTVALKHRASLEPPDANGREAALLRWGRAADLGDAEAAFFVGRLHYDNGQAPDDDAIPHRPVAITWLTVAADAGHAEAEFLLGFCYFVGGTRGCGVKRDVRKADALFARAAAKWHAKATTFRDRHRWA